MTVTPSAPAQARATSEYGVLAGAIAVFAWGLGPLFVRAMGVSTPTTVAYRLIIAVPVMHIAAWLFGGRVTRRLMRVALVPGVLFGTSLITGFAAVNNTSVSNATLISNLMPVAVVILAKFVFDEKVRNRQFVAVGVALTGMLIVVFGAGSSGDASFFGDFLAVVNVVIWTAFFLRMKNLRDDGIHSWSLLAAVTTVAAIVAVPPCLLASNDLGSMTPKSWVFLLAMVLLPGVVGHGLMTWASGHLPVTVSSLLTLGSPVVSAVGAWLWLNQSMTEWQCVGSVIVLGALGAIALNARVEAVREASLARGAELAADYT
jgi:drug/metabolite transporter (DMT)-like permease